jgi:hypothetical protein
LDRYMTVASPSIWGNVRKRRLAEYRLEAPFFSSFEFGFVCYRRYSKFTLQIPIRT